MRRRAGSIQVSWCRKEVSYSCTAWKTNDILDPMPMTESELQAARSELERVLGSPAFTRNERLGRFLRFVVERHLEGKDEEIKESVLAVEVFGRSPNHDPKQ